MASGNIGAVKNAHLVAILLILCSLSADARLNDSRLDLTQRFGQPRAEKMDQFFGSRECTFSHDGWTIRAWLINGRCHRISYSNSAAGSAGMTEAQIVSLMESNADGATWKKDLSQENMATVLMGRFTNHHYSRSDQKAYCVKGGSSLTFKSDHWITLEVRAKAEKMGPATAVPDF